MERTHYPVRANGDRPLRVLVNAVSAGIGGGGTHVESQIRALCGMDGVALTVYATGQIGDRLAATSPEADIRVRPALALWRRLVWEQVVLASRARRYDCVYVPGNFALLLAPSPQVLTVQNAWYFTDPVRRFRRRRCSALRRLRLMVESVAVRASIRRADRVVAISQGLRHAIEADLGRLDTLEVVLSAPPTLPLADSREPSEPGDYILVVAHDEPHKDWNGLIETWLRHPELPRLVIAGGCSDPRRQALEDRLARTGAGDRIRLLGVVADRRQLALLYRRARCYLAHSHFESFGLTVCEAMLAGAPVVASDLPAHREIGGTAVSYYDAADLDALAKAVRTTVAEHRAGAPPSGSVPILARSWADNARELLAILHAASGRPPESSEP